MDTQLEAIQETPKGVSAADNRIATKFKFWPLIRFVLPTMAMSLFMALFKSVDDGLFVSQFVGKDALSAVNIAFPIVMGTWGIAIMFATGGSAIAGKKIGEGKPQEARRDFTSVCIIAAIVSAIVALPCMLFMEPIMRALGADDSIMGYCTIYGYISVGTLPFAALSPIFEFFYVTSGAPKMGLVSTILRGAMNIFFDYLFIVVLKFEVMGVALATAAGDLATCLLGVFFYLNKKHAVHFAKPSTNWGSLLGHSCKNGVSEMLNHVAMAITSFIINATMLRLIGKDGVAANGVIGNLSYIMSSMFIGFSNGIAPVYSYNYGNQDHKMMRRLVRYSLTFLAVANCATVIICQLAAKPLISIFITQAKEPELFQIVLEGLRIYALCFFFNGFGIATSGMFAALSNGKVASIISVTRNMVLTVVLTVAFSYAFGLTGVWVATPVGEFISACLCMFLIYKYRNVYGYGKEELAPIAE